MRWENVLDIVEFNYLKQHPSTDHLGYTYIHVVYNVLLCKPPRIEHSKTAFYQKKKPLDKVVNLFSFMEWSLMELLGERCGA